VKSKTGDKQVAEKKSLDVSRILGIQLDHFISKDTFWYGFAWAQAILLFWYWPR